MSSLNIEEAVKERYSAASEAQEQALCCPVSYDTKYLEVLPAELIERDYGCGDPSQYVKPGETVLDLGSGGGKICYIAAQIVGPEGKVLGVDMNDDMLTLAHQFKKQITDRIGYDNVTFFKGRIQDLATDIGKVEALLQQGQIDNANDWLEFNQKIKQQSRVDPMIADNSVDVVLSNCVLNLVDPSDRRQMIEEIHRVLKPGGRAVISDIVSDEEVPQHMKDDPKLWSGCISGAFLEKEFLEAFEKHGFFGVEILTRQTEPWVTVEDIEFRSMTVRAYKRSTDSCLDYGHAVVYNGPWKAVIDDEDHVLKRGERMAVCKKNFQVYTSEPYCSQITAIPPAIERSDSEATPFDCHPGEIRDPKVTKAGQHQSTSDASKSTSTLGLPIAGCCGSDSTDCC